MMKQIPFVLIGIAVLFSAISSCKHESFDERCAREAREYTQKQCPQRIDSGITLDSMTYKMTGMKENVQERNFMYYYTFSGKQDSLLNKMLKEFPDTARKRLDDFKTALLNGLTNSVQLKPYKDKGFNFEYIYYSKKAKKVLLHYKFTKTDYKH